MKNSQKGFALVILLIVIAVVAIGGGLYYYSKSDDTTITTVASITNVNVSGNTWPEGVYTGNPLIITWNTNWYGDVDIDLLKADGSVMRSIAKNVKVNGWETKYEWMVDDIQAWRATDNSVMVQVSHGQQKAVSKPFKMSGAYPNQGVSGNPVDDWKTYENKALGFKIKYDVGWHIDDKQPMSVGFGAVINDKPVNIGCNLDVYAISRKDSGMYLKEWYGATLPPQSQVSFNHGYPLLKIGNDYWLDRSGDKEPSLQIIESIKTIETIPKKEANTTCQNIFDTMLGTIELL